MKSSVELLPDQSIKIAPPEDAWRSIIDQQRLFFSRHATLDVEFRIAALKRLQKTLVQREPDILDALRADLSKAPFETYATELGFVLEELRYVLAHLRRWVKPQRVSTPLVHFPSSSWIYPEPLGVVLVISAWNYPIQLTFAPLIAAIAAGNCVVIKPSRHARQSALLMEEIIRTCFEPGHVTLIQGSDEANAWALETRFDHIFFTGSTSVGREVMAAAARYLTPVTLELGGKSPCIVDQTANIEIAARRIAWGKCVAAGQSCVAPDYVLVHKAVKSALVERIEHYVRQFYGENPLANPDYPKIINERQFTRLRGYMDGPHALSGGRVDAAAGKIEPTLYDGVSLGDPIMQAEIFGPLLPILEFENVEEALEVIGHFEKPLSVYLFTRDRAFEQRVLSTVPFGGGCVNDTLIQLANPRLPFGGVGASGTGSYHGHYGFKTFTHSKSIIKKSDRIDILLRYPPFANHLGMIKRLMR